MDNMNMDNMKIILEHPVGGHPVFRDALNLHPLAEAPLLSKHTIVDPHVVHVHVVHAVHAQAEGGGEETVSGGHLPFGHLPVKHLLVAHDVVVPPQVVSGQVSTTLSPSPGTFSFAINRHLPFRNLPVKHLLVAHDVVVHPHVVVHHGRLITVMHVTGHFPVVHLPVRHLPVAGHDIVESQPVIVEGHSISVHVAFHLEHVVVDKRREVHHVGGHLGAHHTGLDGRAGEAVVLLLVVAHPHAGHLLVGHVLVLAHDPESLVIGHVLHLLAETIAVDIRVVALDSGLGVADLKLLRVAVGVAVGVVAKVVLLVVLVDALINVLPVLAAHGHLLVAHSHAGHLPVGELTTRHSHDIVVPPILVHVLPALHLVHSGVLMSRHVHV